MEFSMKTSHVLPLAAILLSTLGLACNKERKVITIDGSSTVYPITQAVAEEFQKGNKGVHATVGISGTGGGFKKFCANETHISDASRPIKKSEVEKCAEKKIEYIELPVAYDGLSVVMSKENTFVDQLSLDELKKIFDSEKPAKTWQDVRASFPAEPIKVYSPGQDSGTFDYFNEVVLGKDRKVRGDAVFSEDDNVLVKGVAGSKGAIGFFGVAYYEENRSTLKAIAIVNPKSKKAELPTVENIMGGIYAPLSRPIFIYVKKATASEPEIKSFVEFYLDHGPSLVKQAGYIPLKPSEYTALKAYFAAGKTGSPASTQKEGEGALDIGSLYK